ncbi:interleukin 21 receptor, tandem duplicate 1 [Stigmatopora argus]
MAALVWLFWDLLINIQSADSSVCGVSCFTDYKVLINCSCARGPARPLRLRVNCSDGELHAVGGCLLTPPRPWCVAYPPGLNDIAAVGTDCTTAVGGDSSSWALYNAVKPAAPHDVRATGSPDGGLNITWEHADAHDQCLGYSLRIRGPWPNPARSLAADGRFLAVRRDGLPPGARFRADVRAKWCPENPSQGPWSDWSSSVHWTSADVAARGWRPHALLAVFIPAGAVTALALVFLLACPRKRRWLKRLRRSVSVCRPNDFFQPLYLDYGGDFKEWVKPVFGEHDLLRNATATDTPTAAAAAEEEPDSGGQPRLLRYLVVPVEKGHASIDTVTVRGGDDDNAPDFRQLSEEDAATDGREAADKSPPWDDTYPRLELDTVGGVFRERASPSRSGARQPSDFPDESLVSHSHYVKQWIMGSDHQGAFNA